MDTKRIKQDLSNNYWNYRWIKIVHNIPKLDKNFNKIKGETEQEIFYELHEVYYNENDKPIMWSENAIDIYVYNAEEIITLFTKMLDASMEKVLIIKNNTLQELNEYINNQKILETLKRSNTNE